MKPARSTAPEGPTGKLYEEILDLIAAGTTPAAVTHSVPQSKLSKESPNSSSSRKMAASRLNISLNWRTIFCSSIS